MRKYRKHGIGRQVALHISDLFHGRWEIYQAQTNLIAKQFWQNVIEAYTAGIALRARERGKGKRETLKGTASHKGKA